MVYKSTKIKPFWQTKTLDQMTMEEWESLCDNCGQCCLHKIEDVTSNQYVCSNIACKLLDLNTGRCKDYPNRKTHVPDCVQLTPDMVKDTGWLPATCAYRLIAENKELPSWHPLISQDPRSVVEAGISIQGRSVSEILYKDGDHALEIWMKEGRKPLWIQPIKAATASAKIDKIT